MVAGGFVASLTRRLDPPHAVFCPATGALKIPSWFGHSSAVCAEIASVVKSAPQRADQNHPDQGVMSDPVERGVAGWTVEQHLAFDIGFALPRAPIKGFRKPLTEDDRRVIAKSIVEHLKLRGWRFQMSNDTKLRSTEDLAAVQTTDGKLSISRLLKKSIHESVGV
jgi:hypothetical protein